MRYFQKLTRLLREKNGRTHADAPDRQEARKLSQSLTKNLDAVAAEFGDSCDLVVRTFSFGRDGNVRAALVFLDGMADLSLINDDIIKPLMYDSLYRAGETSRVPGMDEIRDRLLTAGDVKSAYTLEQVLDFCLSGDAVLMVEGSRKALGIGAKGWDKRAVTEPDTENVIRGPREGFTENLRTNTAMIRRKIKSPVLKMRTVVIGERTRTLVNILYIDGITNPALVRETERRLKSIRTDAILAAGYLEQYIEDQPYSAFQTIWYSEKPDAIAGKLLEGRAAIVVDGTPFVLSVPMLFMENFQTAEDYVIRSYYATALRILRLTAFVISLFAPAVYIALTTFHQELIPTTLLFTMAAASEGIPFPAAVEMGVIMLSFEILREAGIRMPRNIGQAVSIVGALVLGEAAVQAGLVGAPVVIVMAFTAVAGFVNPSSSDAVTILRWFLMLMAATMGSFGITLALFVILIHLMSLKSFGANYLAPFAPFQPADLKDTIVRAPLWAMRSRPAALKPQDLWRQDTRDAFAPSAQGGENPGDSP
jgi:spore germination protein KA